MEFFCSGPDCDNIFCEHGYHSTRQHPSPFGSPVYRSQEYEVTRCQSPVDLLPGSDDSVSWTLDGGQTGGCAPTQHYVESPTFVHSDQHGESDDLVCLYRADSRGSAGSSDSSSSSSEDSSSDSSTSSFCSSSECHFDGVCQCRGAPSRDTGAKRGRSGSPSARDSDRRVRGRCGSGPAPYEPLVIEDSEDEVLAAGVDVKTALQAAACDLAPLRADVGLTDVGESPAKQFTAYRLLATFPQNDMKKEVMLERIRAKFKNFKMVLVCEEEHHEEDSVAASKVGVHLHVLIWFNHGQKHTRNIWDAIGGNKGVHLARCGSTDAHHRRTVEYVCKDGNYVCDPEGYEVQWLEVAKESKKKKRGKFDEVAALVQSGKTDQELVELHPGFVMSNYNKIESYRRLLESFKATDKGVLVPFNRSFFVEDCPGFDDMISWFDANFWNPSFGEKRPIKTPNLWLKAPSNFGKTWLFDSLRKCLRIWVHPMESNGWADTYEDNKYDLIVFDEFKGGMTIQTFNKWCDGSPIQVLRRNKPPLMKYQNVPVLVLSNFTPDACWHNVNQHDRTSIQAVCARFNVISLDGPPGSLAKIIRTDL